MADEFDDDDDLDDGEEPGSGGLLKKLFCSSALRCFY